MDMAQPVLYYKPNCPYCEKVFHQMRLSGVSMKTVDISQDEESKIFLQEKGGKIQVPCLLTKEGTSGEKLLYESSLIVEWVIKNQEDLLAFQDS